MKEPTRWPRMISRPGYLDEQPHAAVRLLGADRCLRLFDFSRLEVHDPDLYHGTHEREVWLADVPYHVRQYFADRLRDIAAWKPATHCTAAHVFCRGGTFALASWPFEADDGRLDWRELFALVQWCSTDRGKPPRLELDVLELPPPDIKPPGPGQRFRRLVHTCP